MMPYLSCKKIENDVYNFPAWQYCKYKDIFDSRIIINSTAKFYISISYQKDLLSIDTRIFTPSKFEKKHSFKSAPLNLFNQHINSEILHILGFSAQKTFLGICDDYLVLCCKNFVPEGSKLITFDVFLRQSYNSYELTEFTDLDQFEHVLNEHELLHLYKDKLTKSFWDMVVLDVFLMNLERTTTDYGYLIYKDVVTPAPLFDNRTDGQACTVPLRKDGKPILRDDLLYSNEFKDFHDAVVRILPVLECKMDDIYNLIHKQECLSESQKSWKFEQLQKTLHDLKCSYAIS